MRGAIITVGALLLLLGVVLAIVGAGAAALWPIFMGLLLLIGTAIEQWRYKLVGGRRPGPDWEVTGERFVDPETGKLVTVYFHPRTGERRYISG